MGLDAFVRCNCFKARITSEPPFPWEDLMMDEEGGVCLIEAHNAWNERIQGHIAYDEHRARFGENDDVLWAWQRECCSHEDMEYCSEWVGNWAGVRRFEGIVDSIGKEFFPVLSTMIPNGNGGFFLYE